MTLFNYIVRVFRRSNDIVGIGDIVVRSMTPKVLISRYFQVAGPPTGCLDDVSWCLRVVHQVADAIPRESLELFLGEIKTSGVVLGSFRAGSC